MKLVIDKNKLNALITKLQSVVPPKATIPILSTILLEASNNEITLTATDLTVGMRCYTDAKVIEEGAVTVPAKRFFQLIKELTAANIEINSSPNEVTEIIAGSSNFRLIGMSKSEFPSLPDLKGATKLTMKNNALREVFFRTAFTVSREDSRYVLTGVLMNIFDGGATFVGTDGKRLAKILIPLSLDKSFQGQYIIPLKAVEEILRILPDDEEIASIFLMNDKIGIQSGGSFLVTKLLSGEYPDFNRVIPGESETKVSLHRDELMTLLRQISLFTQDNSHSVRFSFVDGELKLTANSADIGEGKVSMPVNYKGSNLDIAFNPGYFLDILRHSKNESVTLGITDSYNPGVITDQDSVDEDSDALFVLMPMRLND